MRLPVKRVSNESRDISVYHSILVESNSNRLTSVSYSSSHCKSVFTIRYDYGRIKITILHIDFVSS